MRKSIDRTYELTVEEVQSAIWRYIKESLDQPVPHDPADLTIKWNGPGEAFVSFHERDNG